LSNSTSFSISKRARTHWNALLFSHSFLSSHQQNQKKAHADACNITTPPLLQKKKVFGCFWCSFMTYTLCTVDYSKTNHFLSFFGRPACIHSIKWLIRKEKWATCFQEQPISCSTNGHHSGFSRLMAVEMHSCHTGPLLVTYFSTWRNKQSGNLWIIEKSCHHKHWFSFLVVVVK